jgi:hypothetical protein
MAKRPRSAAQIAGQKKAALASAKARSAKAGSKGVGSVKKSESKLPSGATKTGKVYTVSLVGGKYVGTGRTKVLAHRAAAKKENAYTARAYHIKGGDAAYHSEQMRRGRRIEQGKELNAQGKTGPDALGSRRHSVGGVESTGTRTQRRRAFRARTGKATPAAKPGKVIRKIR